MLRYVSIKLFTKFVAACCLSMSMLMLMMMMILKMNAISRRLGIIIPL